MRKAARVLLLVFALAIPWQYSLDLGPPFGNIARLVGVILLLCAGVSIVRSGVIRKPGSTQWLALAFFTWQSLSALWSIDQRSSFAHLSGIFQEVAIVWLIWEFVESEAEFHELLLAYVVGCWVLALLTIWAFVSSHTAGQARFVAEGQDPNDAARYLDLAFPMAALLWSYLRLRLARALMVMYFPVGILSVVLTASREGAVGGAVALTGCAILMARSHLRLAIAGLSAFPLLAGALWLAVPGETLARIGTLPSQLIAGDLNQRLPIWQAGWQAFARAPFLGSGLNTFVMAAALSPMDTAHNTALSIAVETGVVGLILMTAIVAVSCASVVHTTGSVRMALITAFAVWLVGSLVASVQENRTTWLLLGVIAVAARLADSATTSESRSAIRLAAECTN